MKAKKLLALTLALILALSCMSITAFAESVPFSKDFTVNIPKITIGTTATEIKEGITFADSTIAEEIEIVDFEFGVSGTELDSVETAGQYLIAVVFKIKNTDVYTGFDWETSTEFGYETDVYTKTITFSGDNIFSDEGQILTAKYSSGEIAVGKPPYIYLFQVLSFEVYDEYDGTEYLDLEEGDEYLDTKTGIEQTYTATVTTNKTDKTKVEVSWKLENIAVSVTNNKVWDTEKLIWVDDTANQNIAEANDVTAEFDFVNCSSINIDAQVTFEVADGFTAITPTFTDNGVTEKADGIITLGTKADGEDTDNDGEIKATISPVDADFASLTENKTEQKYGTYTVTIREQAPAKTVCATFVDGTTMSWEELKAKYNVTDTSIGDGAFAESNLVSIIIPNGVTSIGEGAFTGCVSLETITIPNSVESIGEWAFAGCESLETITIPNSVESIGDFAFIGTNLVSIIIPNSVTSIGLGAFASCTSLKEITIPNSVTSIGMSVFRNCTSLKTITIPNSVESIYSEAFSNCTSLETVTILDGVTSIGERAFESCESLKTITIPNSVTSISRCAFEDCSNLTINCSAFISKPSGWENDWNIDNLPVIWGN